MKFRPLAVAGIATAAILAPASSAFALDQTVTGTTATSLALSVPTPALFLTNFSPGNTASSTGGTLTAVSTNPSWTLSAKDGAVSGANGKMDAAALGCTTSASELGNAASLATVPAVANGSITSTTRSLTGANQSVANASAVPLAATVFNTNYSQAIGDTELLAAGCVYTLTTTFTLA